MSIQIKKLNSSLQFFDFSNMSPQEIVDKYEETLFKRENQIKELSSAIGAINEKLEIECEKNKTLEQELKNKEALLIKEIKNKDIIFEQMNSLISENEKLKMMIKENQLNEKKENNFKNTENGISNVNTLENKKIEIIKEKENNSLNKEEVEKLNGENKNEENKNLNNENKKEEKKENKELIRSEEKKEENKLEISEKINIEENKDKKEVNVIEEKKEENKLIEEKKDDNNLTDENNIEEKKEELIKEEVKKKNEKKKKKKHDKKTQSGQRGLASELLDYEPVFK